MTNRPAAPLRLRRVAKADIPRLNSLFKPRRSLDVGADMRLHEYRGGKVILGASPVRIEALIGDTPLVLCCQHRLLTMLLAAQDLMNAHADLAPLVLELALDPLLTTLENALKARISIKSVTQAAAQPTGTVRLLELDAFGETFPLVLLAPLPALESLFSQWKTAPLQALDLSIAAHIRVGSTDLTADLIHTLQAGDAILFERRVGGPSSGKLVIGDRLLADAVWNDGWRLMNTPASQHRGEDIWLARPQADAIAPSGGNHMLKEHDIPMTVCFDLGQGLVPLRVLRDLKAGSKVDLPKMSDEPIRMTVDGHCIGHGELMQIEGRNAVRVMKMYHHE